MPEMDGFELLESIKKEHSHLPIVMITAYEDENTISKIKHLGGHKLIPKPVDFDV